MIETFVLMELARQLTWCRERARLHHYTGQQTLLFGDRLRALPIDALWNSAP